MPSKRTTTPVQCPTEGDLSLSSVSLMASSALAGNGQTSDVPASGATAAEAEISLPPPSSAAAPKAAAADKWPGWPGDSVFRLIVPVLKVGSIIGRKGEFVKKMCEETRARIRILEGAIGTIDRIVSNLPPLPFPLNF